MGPEKKLAQLKKKIAGMGSVLLAFSGGVDSGFLLNVAAGILPKNKLLAITANSPTYPREELEGAKKISRALGVRHRVIKTRELSQKRFAANSPERCYFCKKELFRRLNAIAAKEKLNFVIDASNASDKKDFRPGNRARQESRVRSPLEEVGLTKEDIRALSKRAGLSTWDKPAQACLASRIPYGTKITLQILKRVEAAEGFLRHLGFRQVRLRHYNGLCRIEVTKNEIPELINQRGLVVENLRKLGYRYVTVDLEGYRTGSLNPALPNKNRVKLKARAGHAR
jgi:uncharacterized protein